MIGNTHLDEIRGKTKIFKANPSARFKADGRPIRLGEFRESYTEYDDEKIRSFDKEGRQVCMSYMKGFTLLELMLTIGILGIVGAAGVESYRAYGKNVEVSSYTQSVIGELRRAQGKAMAGESGMKWGIHFVNGTTDYYELYATPGTYASGTTVISSTTTLPKSLSFSDPSDGQTKDILFGKISGNTTATSVTLVSEDVTKTIQVTSIGTISR